ncbi:hypothetical protein BJX63DRAFT_427005 [Aspergillus granulosus]|uniref:Uncharacterized protein n=1 Tax=Aspergillus granulosus TaxID=176169 RepID=A0ABR4I477_9EURO
MANIKYFTALLYPNEHLGFPTPSRSSRPSAVPAWLDKVLGAGEPSKPHLVTLIIESIATLPGMTTLLWPLFILGNAGVEDECPRRFVLDRLLNIQRLQLALAASKLTLPTMYGTEPPTAEQHAMENSEPDHPPTHPTLLEKMKKRLAHIRKEWGPLLAAKEEWDDEYNFAEGRYAGQGQEQGKKEPVVSE